MKLYFLDLYLKLYYTETNKQETTFILKSCYPVKKRVLIGFTG
jgi:hypothetical protein